MTDRGLCFAILLCFGGLGIAGPASAQRITEPRPEDRVIYLNAVQNTVNRVKEIVAPSMEAGERKRFLSTNFIIDVQNDEYAGMFADNSRNAIHLPLGFFILSDQIEFAMQINNAAQLPSEPVSVFVKTFITTLRYNAERTNRTRKKPFPILEDFVAITPAQIQSITSTSDFQAMHVGAKVSSMAIIMLHEFYHLEKNEDEAAADDYAISRAHAAGLSVYSAVWSFAIFGYIEESVGSVNKRYRPAACRTTNLLRQSIAYHDKDADFMAFLAQRGLLEKWRASPAQLEAVLKEEGINCSGPSEQQSETPESSGKWPGER